MAEPWDVALERWLRAGLVDGDAASRIRAYERDRTGPRRVHWLVKLALVFGGVMLGAGALLFVSSHWEALSPSERFAIVLGTLAALHASGVASADRWPALSTTLHGVGTIALGGAIFLTAQIFNLSERWSTGVLLWALGAIAGWTLLDDAPQIGLTALLVPAWLSSEWIVITWRSEDFVALRVLVVGVFMLALSYFTVDRRVWGRKVSVVRWIGGVVLVVAALALWMLVDPVLIGTVAVERRLEMRWVAAGWFVAACLPLGVAFAMRRNAAWVNLIALAWIAVLLNIDPKTGGLMRYGWLGAGWIGLAAWGVHDGDGERVNLGAALFGVTVIAFYFSQVMDKLGRSASLVGLGVLFLGGGWLLEKTRRSLVSSARGGAA